MFHHLGKTRNIMRFTSAESQSLGLKDKPKLELKSDVMGGYRKGKSLLHKTRHSNGKTSLEE